MIPRDRSKYGSPFPGLSTLPTPFYHFSVTGGDSWADAMHAMEDACNRAQRRIERQADECHHCGAPSPGKRCRFCGTGEAPTLPPDACPSCRSHVETVTGMADFGEDTLVAQVCNCPTVTIYEVPERGAARLVETKPNPRFYQAVVNADGKTIGYTTRKGGA